MRIILSKSEKAQRDLGLIISGAAFDLLWGGNERSIVAGDYYYRYPSQTTSLELTETTTAIDYARVMVNKLITNVGLTVPLITKNTNLVFLCKIYTIIN